MSSPRGRSADREDARVVGDAELAEDVEDLEDAQQAMRLTRTHAAEWHIDPHRIGVIGFSAGAHLAAVLSTHPDFQGKNVPASTIQSRPDFQMIIYPGWLNGSDGKVNPSLQPNLQTPPTFLLQAENDYTAHVENALVYFQALKDAKVPAELHLFTQGGMALGSVRRSCLSRTGLSWLRPGCIRSMFWGRLEQWDARDHGGGDCGEVRVRQMSRRVVARVKRTGPRTMPMGPKTAMPPSMESRMVAVWARRWEPTRVG